MGCTATKQKVKIGSKLITVSNDSNIMIDFEKQLDNRELRDILSKFRQIRVRLSASTDGEDDSQNYVVEDQAFF